MKKLYKISRIIIALGVVILFNILIINEDKSWLIVPWIFGIVTYALSFLSSIISKKIIEVGNKIKIKYIKVLYYMLLPVAIVGLFILLLNYIILPISDLNEPDTTDMSVALSHVFTCLFIQVVVFIGLVLPYVQTLIVLILNHFKKVK